MADLVKFSFQGDELDVVRDGERLLIGVKRVCEALGVDPWTQLRKLKADPAIGIVIMLVPSEGGPQETACIEVRALPLWLATIHPSKVWPEIRGKLIAYKREAAEVLAGHFLGPRRPMPRTVLELQEVGEHVLRELKAADDDDAALLVQRTLGILRGEMRPAIREPPKSSLVLIPKIMQAVREANARGVEPSGEDVREWLMRKGTMAKRVILLLAIRWLVAEGRLMTPKGPNYELRIP